MVVVTPTGDKKHYGRQSERSSAPLCFLNESVIPTHISASRTCPITSVDGQLVVGKIAHRIKGFRVG
jgi:hypothetical protein